MFLLEKCISIYQPSIDSHLSLPIFTSRVSAGFPSPADDFMDGVLDLNDLIKHPSATFIIRVSGDSMTGSGIFDGDLLVVDRSLKARSGQIVVAVSDGDMLVKRLKRQKGRWWLIPDALGNNEFQPISMGEGSEIWGVVKNVIRNLS
jgi:DNA polymerase V